jgi:glyoxylase-like metal-dependent hydrolase (beta-lactamase superfamily II)
MRRINIRGNNPGPLTRGGTNTWLLPGKEPTLIDAAEDNDEYAARVAEALEAEQPGAVLKRVLVTHGHVDHVAGIAALRRRWPDLAFAKMPGENDARCGVTFEPIEDEAVVRAGDSALWAIHTPGHAPDHVCYYEPTTAVVFCGDLLVNGGTITIPPSHGGNLRQYMKSLRRVLDLQPRQGLAGHGDPIDNPPALIRAYIGHRLMREQQIVDVLDAGPASIDAIVSRVYPGLQADLIDAAAENVHAHLIKLLEDGRASKDTEPPGTGEPTPLNAVIWTAIAPRV